MSIHPGTAQGPTTPQLTLLDAQYQVPVTYDWGTGDGHVPATLRIGHNGQGWTATVCGWEICDALIHGTDSTGLAYAWARTIPPNQPLFNSPQNAVNAAFTTQEIQPK